ncbi:MAG TPA: ATP synthase F0 subunit B [Thermoanaerobaculia bacterium]
MSLLALLLFSEGAEAAKGPFGLPMTVWQLANLAGFLGALLYFVARPITNLFRLRQLDIAKRLADAERQRAEAARLEVQIHERLAALEHELEEVRVRGTAEGESARAELLKQAERDADTVGRSAQEQIARRLESAKEELRGLAAALTTKSAAELLSSEINDEDQHRLLQDSVSSLRSGAR